MPVTMNDVLAYLRADEPNYDAAARLGPEALEPLNHLVRGDDSGLASKAAYLAGLIGDVQSVEVLRNAAQHLDPAVRVATAAAVQFVPADAVAPLFAVLARDSDMGVRRIAIESLPERLGSDVVNTLREIARDDQDEFIRRLATQKLSREEAIVILPPSSSLPVGKATPPTNYKQTFTAKGGTPPYRFEVVVPQGLPPGLALSHGGVLSGVPTRPGRFNFAVTAIDSAGVSADPQVYTIVID
ncbi:MAG TPA: HEAT repeat domain-containing protein [Thermoanaerobaculia bacterium]|nr:HEAT repeat domain-containing protein [Thermoanaerobaculia bacterium]